MKDQIKMGRNISIAAIVCAAMILLMAGVSNAATEGRACIPEPTDEPIEFGELINCEINPVGDMDTFRFDGSDGDRIRLHAISLSPDSTVCVELFDPDDFRLTRQCGLVNYDVILDKTGEYSIEIAELGINSTMDYWLKYNCEVICPPDTFSYFPVTPCRIVDTRKGGGIIGASVQRNFRVYGSGSVLAPQGGDSGGCPSPGGQPYAAHLNMVAVNPTGKGNLQAFPVGAGKGAGLSVNYNTIDTNLANAGTVKTVTGSGPDITVASNFSSAHTVIDVLGYYSEEKDLLYTPVKPCRIVDTRKTSAGIIDAGTKRDFRVFGSVGGQGGNSAGCPSAGGQPLAAHINMVAVNPIGKGNLQAFPVGAGVGVGLSVNYNTIDTNLANAGTVKTVTGAGPDISVASNFSSAHTVIDVLGYYYQAPAP